MARASMWAMPRAVDFKHGQDARLPLSSLRADHVMITIPGCPSLTRSTIRASSAPSPAC